MASIRIVQPEQSSVFRVFGINELLATILSFVPLEQRFSLHCVASSWQATSHRLLVPWTARTPSELEEIRNIAEKEALEAQEFAIRRSKSLRPVPRPDPKSAPQLLRPRAKPVLAVLNTAILFQDRAGKSIWVYTSIRMTYSC